MWQTPLSKLIEAYNGAKHPICGPLIKGGPCLLATKYVVRHGVKYVDACHFCFMVRRALIDEFPEFLNPKQVYGIKN